MAAPEVRPDPDHDAVCGSGAHHLVVVAPPGTGKTFLAVRLAGEVAGTLPMHARVLVLTFSNQARVQLEIEGARQLPSRSRARVEVTNYHRFFWHAILAYRRALGLPMKVDLVSRKRRLDALQRGVPGRLPSLRRQQVLVERLAEQRFAEFREEPVPPLKTLQPMLDVVHAEHRAGRLIFDDLGALFWELVNRFPTVDAAYRTRYPVVIADEHQGESALQDAVVRRLGSERLVIFADPMQLIHGFRGASLERLERHLVDCGEQRILSTPHRWNGNPEVGEWLLGVRARLEGKQVSTERPRSLRIVTTPAAHGFNGVLSPTKFAVLNALRNGCRRVAVLAWRNDDVARLRDYLSRSRMFPRHIGGSDDFEEAREVIEQLPSIADPRELALGVVEKIASLVPTLPSPLKDQVQRRLSQGGVNRKGCTQQASALLDAIEPVYSLGPAHFFRAVWDGLRACTVAGYHLPRGEAVRALRETAEEMVGGLELDDVLEKYSARVASAMHAAPRLGHGVFVMTAHQAKGKEFDAVVLCYATARDFPASADGRRLFYVAITRATSEWVIIAPAGQASPLIDCL